MTDQTQTTTEPVERDAFEAWYCDDAKQYGLSFEREAIARLREGDDYGPERVAINSKWEGWQARAALTTPQPLAIGLDREAARKALMSFLFGECQPDRGDIFGWVDDRSGEIIDFIISKAAKPEALALAAPAEGYVLVPVEPTEAMIAEGRGDAPAHARSYVSAIYRAMIAACLPAAPTGGRS